MATSGMGPSFSNGMHYKSSSLRPACTASFLTQNTSKMVRAPFIDQNGVRKGAWSVEEDGKLKAYIEKYGHWNWRELPRFAGLTRCGKSCRLRWMNYLRPDVKRGSYSEEEENLIIRLHNKHGNKWSTIAANLPGRTDNEIKNHWHTHLKKRLQQKSTAAERSPEQETPDHDRKISNGSARRSEKEGNQTVPSSSSSSSSFSSSSMYQILESSAMSSEATSYPTASITEDSFSPLAEDVWAEEFVPDIFSNFGDLLNLPISGYDEDGDDSVFTENIWGHDWKYV